jgi:general secretion pathway protein K
MWAGLQISVQTRMLGEDQLHSIIQTQALYLAIGGCYEALARMQQAQPLQSNLPSGQDWEPDGKPRVVVYKSGLAVVIMQSDDQKINVNTAGAAQLSKVLEKAGANEQISQTLASRIADFVKSQNGSQLQGLGSPIPGASLNKDTGFGGPLTSLDQLMLVPGVSQQLFYGYKQGMQELKSECKLTRIPIPANDSLFSQLTVQGSNANMQQGVQNLQGIGGQQATPFTQISWTVGGTYRILSFGKSALGAPSAGIRLTVRLQGGGTAPYQIVSRKVL